MRLSKRTHVFPFRHWISVTLLVLLLALTEPTTLIAQDTSDPISNHAYAFAQHVSITLTLPPETQVDEVNLFLRAGRGPTEIYPLIPENGEATYQRDVRERPLPPFTEITYWWKYQDTSGTEQTTSTTTFLYEDNRFAWETLKAPEMPLSLHWVSGSLELMTAGLDIARTALEEITTQLRRVELTETRIYIYPSRPDLQQALRLSGRAWIGGEAHPEVGVILVAIPPNNQAISRMRNLLPHEITHLVLYRQLGVEGYTNLPTWLNEGLASYFEQRPEPDYALALDDAQKANRWIALETLCQPFYDMPPDQVVLAYAESQSVTRYLIETYGWREMRELLERYADGLSCSRGLEEVMDIDLITLEREWKIWLEQKGAAAPPEDQGWAMISLILQEEIAPWLLIALLLLTPVLLVILIPHSLRRAQRA